MSTLTKQTMFECVYGHARQKRILEHFARNGTTPHALLFEGEPATGKLLMAREFAMALTERDTNRVYVIQRLDGKKNIAIDQIRGIKREAGLTGFSAGNRVFIIDEAEKLTVEAANSFLKLLEEPPDNVVFILISSAAANIPATILSRLIRVPFCQLSEQELATLLISNGSGSDEAVAVAKQAKCDAALALSIVKTGAGIIAETNNLVTSIEQGGYRAVYSVAEKLQQLNATDKEQALLRLKLMRFFWHTRDSRQRLKRFVNISGCFDDAERALSGNANFRMVCEKLFIEIQNISG